MKKLYILSLLIIVIAGKVNAQFTASLSGDPLSTTGWTVGGDASVVDSTIRLTPASGDQAGYVYYSTAVNLTTCAEFTVDFDFKIKQSGTTTVADGIAFWYISNPPSGFITGGGIGLPSYPDGLLMILDTYDNVGSPDLNPKETLLGYNGTESGYVEGASAGVLCPVVTEQYFIDDGSWHHCHITYNSGAIKVYFNYSATPSLSGTYTLTIDGYFGFSSSTGADYSTQSVKNVYIDAVGLSGPPTLTDSVVSYCQFATADTLTATASPGNPLFWYTTDTATTVALPGTPTPSTLVADTTWYFVRQGAGTCLSNADSIEVIVNPIPAAPVITGDTVYCEDSAFMPFTITGTDVLWYTAPTGTGIATAPVVPTTAPGIYTYYATQTSLGCTSAEDSISVDVHVTPATPTLTSGDTTYCQYFPFVPLTVSGTNILWYTTASGGTGSTTAPVINTNIPGVYHYYVTQTVMGCESQRLPLTITVYAKPEAPSVTPVIYCQNKISFPLTADGSNLTWYGIGVTMGYTTAPTPSTTTPGTYFYYVTQTVNGCLSDSSTLIVVVDTTPNLTASSNSPLCQYSTLNLYSSSTTPGATYSWTNSSSFTSTEQNPVVDSVPVSAGGLYVVTATLGSCSFPQSVEVIIDSIPVLTYIIGDTVCSGIGNDLLLQSGFTPSTFGTFSWTGPDGFTSTLPNPTIISPPTTASGVYSVTETVAICTSAVYTVSALVDSTPANPTIGSNTPVCQGDTLQLFSSDATAGVTYSWTGPNGFVSTQQDPFITDVPVENEGTYSLTVTLNGTCSNYATTPVVVTITPSFTPTSNSPVCSGDTLLLYANGVLGSTYSWTGPYPYAFATYTYAANPVIAGVSTESSGVYTVTALYLGCTTSEVDTVVINPTPAPPSVSWLTYCQYFPAPPLMADNLNLTWYGADTISALDVIATPLPPTSVVGSSFYYLTQTVNGCISAMDSIQVTVNPTPTVTVTPADTSVCPHAVYVLTATDADPITYYHWYPSIYLSGTDDASVTVSPETNVIYTVVASNQFGCADSATSSVTVYPSAIITLGDSVTLYPGESYSITASTNCTSFSWFPPAGLSSTTIPNPVASPAISTNYIVYGQTDNGCTTSDSVSISLSANSLLALPNAFTPGNGPNSEFKIITKGEATLDYFRVFNRWGQKVFETTNISAGWDGSFNGTAQPFGVYVYEIEAVTSNGQSFVLHGNVTLVR